MTKMRVALLSLLLLATPRGAFALDDEALIEGTPITTCADIAWTKWSNKYDIVADLEFFDDCKLRLRAQRGKGALYLAMPNAINELGTAQVHASGTLVIRFDHLIFGAEGTERIMLRRVGNELRGKIKRGLLRPIIFEPVK